MSYVHFWAPTKGGETGSDSIKKEQLSGSSIQNERREDVIINFDVTEASGFVGNFGPWIVAVTSNYNYSHKCIVEVVGIVI